MAKFVKGQSGNPRGRVKGIRDRRVQARELFDARREELVSVAVNRALEGDVAALRLCLERICPPYKPTSEPLPLGAMAACPIDRADELVADMYGGGISPHDAAQVLHAMTLQARLRELTDLEGRIRSLEARLGLV